MQSVCSLLDLATSALAYMPSDWDVAHVRHVRLAKIIING